MGGADSGVSDQLRGRRTIVTGAGSGIGRASAHRLAAAGADVLAADIDADAAADTCATGAGPGHLRPAAVDVADERSVLALFARGDELWDGRLDILANIAGVGTTTSALDTTLEDWERVFAVNSRGTFLCCRAALSRMIGSGGGSIVNMASIAGMVGLRNRAPYSASKGAVIALTRALAVEYVGQGVRVNAVCPGTIDTPWVGRLVADAGERREDLVARQPMGRLGTAEEIAGAVLYLASDAAAFVTGSQFVIDGGLTAA
jgi:NAD(P)-dependent dehydrogenase (short-subunit alcohol dehydrogenase family)